MTKYRLTKFILETFLEESGINERVKLGDEKAKVQDFITRARFANMSRVATANKLNYSVEMVDKHIAEIKQLYDMTQKNSLLLPVRPDKSPNQDKLDNN